MQCHPSTIVNQQNTERTPSLTIRKREAKIEGKQSKSREEKRRKSGRTKGMRGRREGEEAVRNAIPPRSSTRRRRKGPHR